MEELKDSELIKFNPDTLHAVRKEFGLDQAGILKQSLDILEAWVAKQSHFVKKDFSRDYLERTLLTCKGSVEKTKVKLDKMCTLKTLLPQYFDSFDSKAEMVIYEDGITHTFLPKMTPTHERVYFGRTTGFKTNDIMPVCKNSIKYFEFLKSRDYSRSIIMILDLSRTNLMEFLPKLSPNDVRNTFAINFDGFGHRLKAIHMISTSKMIDALVSLFKQVLSAKLGERIYVHKAIDTLPDTIPLDILPKDYGGSEKPLKDLHDDLQNYLSSEEFVHYLKEMSKAKTNESLRSSTTFNEQYMGVPGSFKMLSVD